MPWWSRYALLGLVLAGLAAVPVRMLPDHLAAILLALLLAGIAGVYVGIALMVRDPALAAVEVLLALIFLAAAGAGVLVSRRILALGYGIHGLWNLAHHPRYLRSPGPAWYVPLGAAFDGALAAIIIWRF